MLPPAYLTLWAKTSEYPDGPRFHPLAYHLLDVAAVAERLLDHDRLLTDLARRQNVERDALLRFLLLLVALHDIGKASAVFQRLVPEFAQQLAQAGFPVGDADLPPRRHGAVSALYLGAEPSPANVAGVIDALAPGLLTGLRLRAIVDPVAGHHGRPVAPATLDGALAVANKPFRIAAGQMAGDLATLFGCSALPRTFLRHADHDLATLSWLLAALIPVSDWIGSNQDWFAPRAPDLDLVTYWENVARPAAAHAVTASGLWPSPISQPGAARTLPLFAEPTPLQRHVLEHPLPEGPSLFVIEDATGAGKTEAALTLAHRLMQAGRADGFHFSLPTTATADAMFARLGGAYRGLFEEGAKPSLVVAHGRARETDEASVAAFCSATLPLETRRGLARAYARGLGGESAEPQLSSHAYPLATVISGAGAAESALLLSPRSRRRVAVERVASVADAENLVAELAEQGACVALIRTTVDAAIASFDTFVARLGAERVDLLHSRFLPEDRRRHEDDALRRFGKESTPEERRGRVLVATQVVEQSLDIDFDAMVSDLAPIDLLIQRAGRLQRHARLGRPIAAPILHVISPEPRDDANANWLDADLREAAWVYGDVALLWLTARHLFDAAAIETATLGDAERSPAHVRRLVEVVYGADDEALPTQALRDVADAYRGKGYADRSLADFGLLDPHAGYIHDTRKWEAEAKVATRLERPERVTLRLARVEGGRIVPLSRRADWLSSEARVTLTWASGLQPPNDLETAALSPAWPPADESIRLLVIVAGQDGARSVDSFSYDAARGLLKDDAGQAVVT